MKTMRIFAAALLLGALVSCQKEETVAVETKAAPHTVAIQASLGNVTKTVITLKPWRIVIVPVEAKP